MADHPEITAKLDRQNRCIVFSVIGGSKTTTFRTSEAAPTLWEPGSPCPLWAQEAVRAWVATPEGVSLFNQLAVLVRTPAVKGTEGTTVVDRKGR